MLNIEMKYLFTSILLLLFFNNGFTQLNSFNMGDTTQTDLCEGILFDSGGPDGNYQFGEDNTFTICPTESTNCISIEVVNYDIENPFDFLKIYEGNGIEGNLLKSINKKGTNNLVDVKSECVTIQFTSDPTQERAGFELTWKCLEQCPEYEELTIETPHLIGAIPFQANGLSTCFAGNNLETGPCTDDRFLLGDEYIFAYASKGDECISVSVEGVIPETGISIFRGQPTAENAKCISQKQIDEGNLTISNIPLKESGIYYFVLANEFNCTPFDFSITLSENCPTTFPSAADCEDALILNGCSPDLPVALTVEQGEGAADFFQRGTNSGCWEDVFDRNYTWFAFEAQGDGEFAFLLSNNDPNGTVDIDFNIWGPYDKLETACIATKNTQPIRSSWADDMLYSVTGLTNVHPELETPITDTCESLEGDGFLKPLSVKQGEVYVVLINDYNGVIFDGAILLDFAGSDPNVLSSMDEPEVVTRDTFICEGESLQLNAPTAALFEWSDESMTLSCTDCPNPLATPSETTTYAVQATNLCMTTIEETTVRVKPSLTPNVFTPNNDGKNDYFNLVPNQTADVIEVFQVYNRWGKLVYDNDEPEKGWNGNLRNATNEKERQPSGVYVYLIQYKIEEQVETIKGNVTLLR